MRLQNGNASRVSAVMFESDANLRPGRLQRKTLRPFQNHDGWLCKHIFKAERLEIVEALDAVQIGVINLGSLPVDVNKREGGTRDFVFGGSSQTGDDAFRQSGLPAAKIASEQNENRRRQPFRKFPPPRRRFLR